MEEKEIKIRLELVSRRLVALDKERQSLEEEETLLSGLLGVYSGRDYDPIEEERSHTKALSPARQWDYVAGREAILATVKGHDRISRREISEQTGIPQGTIYRYLDKMTKKRLIRVIETAGNTKYYGEVPFTGNTIKEAD